MDAREPPRQAPWWRSAALHSLSHVSVVALFTGLGLVFAAHVRDPVSLAWFVGAVAMALLVVRGLLGDARVRGLPSQDEWDLEGESEPSAPANAASSAPRPEPRRDVDYLRALRHEFRTPLNAVLGFSDVLLNGIDGQINASQREDLQIIRASGIRLRVLLDSAFDITQLADGELRLDLDRVDLRELVSRAAVEAGQLWSNKREACCTLSEGPCIADADEARLRRSILVLADFLATRHRDAQIALSLTVSEGHHAIEITAEPADRPLLDALPTTSEVLAAEDVGRIRQWPVAVTSELIGRHGGSLYHGGGPSRFLIRLPMGDTT